jgi:hypothetical protein
VRVNSSDTLDDHCMVKSYLRILFGQVVIRNTFESIYRKCYLFKKRVVRLQTDERAVLSIKLDMLMSGNKD